MEEPTGRHQNQLHFGHSGRILGLAFAGAAALWIAAVAGSAHAADYGVYPAPQQSALARDTCVNVMRIRQGFTAFNACVESLSRTLTDKNSGPMASTGTVANYVMDRPSETSYSESSIEERRRKEGYSCAQLGIVPGSAKFGQCIAELDGALRSTEHSD